VGGRLVVVNTPGLITSKDWEGEAGEGSPKQPSGDVDEFIAWGFRINAMAGTDSRVRGILIF